MLRDNRHERKIDSLITQLNFIDAVLEHHQLWVDGEDDPEIVRAHIEVMEHLRQTREKYKALLDKCNQRLGQRTSEKAIRP